MGVIPPNIKFAGGGVDATARGGHVLLDQTLRAIQFGEHADACLPEPRSGRGFAPSFFLETFVHLLVGGGTCLSAVRELGEDALFRQPDPPRRRGRRATPGGEDASRRKSNLPSVSGMRVFLHRMGDIGMEGLSAVNRRVISSASRKRRPDRTVILDIDDTFIGADKAGAEKSYKGEPGVTVSTAYIAKEDLMVADILKSGNAKPGDGMAEVIDTAVGNVGKDVHYVVRSDSAGYQHPGMDRCRQLGLDFVIAVRHDVSVQSAADCLPRDAWRRYDESGGEESDGGGADGEESDGPQSWIAETTHTLRKRSADRLTFRVVFVCQGAGGELPEFPSTCLRSYATTLTCSAEEVVEIYKKRGEMENRIKEWKRDLAAGRLPCISPRANAAWVRMGSIAYNVHILLSRALFPGERPRLRTVRWKVLQIPGTLVRHARGLRVKVSDAWHRKLCAWQETVAQIRGP